MSLTEEKLATLQKLTEAAARVAPGEWYSDRNSPGPGAAVSHSNHVRCLGQYPPMSVVGLPSHDGPKGWRIGPPSWTTSPRSTLRPLCSC